ncbi:SSL2 DNA or RNA helicases of superfamily II [uncultured Caudovirales phage]|uniref:SSL2 DNA or RNA helicases of superfamily II n=1 Tax=uncultured Caudovirales phage TaxID=2100421 RepID=A0A6J5KNQ3_9CAUD|nr:SSL2 DNA or RNA helicases of superfamily II [uncultured Caudovirales phage]
MIELRPYQRAAIDGLYAYFSEKDGNPLIVLPTGAGKSLTMAAFIKEAIEAYPSTRILLLTHVKELIEQDARAIINYWHEAPIGIWSAGVGQKVKDQITVAGIQSIHTLPTKFAGTDLVIIDEAHLVSKKSDTMYGRFMAALRKHNPKMKVVGLTATHYRMDSGLLTDGETRIFTDIAYEADVGDLIKQGYLCPLVAKNGATKADLTKVHTRGGEFVASELQYAMDKSELIEGALDEVEAYASERKHVLGFCAGVEHAQHCAERCRARGWTAAYVSGDMTNFERDKIIGDFKAGRVRFLFNAMLLTTGFDAPHIDCILMLRPTKSTGLYVQIMGRGLRKHPSKENTLVLDFAGNVERHGPIDQIRVKKKREKGEGVSVAPVKECPSCHELLMTMVMTCPQCGHEFPASAPHGTEASEAVLVAALQEPKVYTVDSVEYEYHDKIGKAPSMKVTYWCGPSGFTEWVPIEDTRSYVKKHAIYWFYQRGITCPATVADALAMGKAIPAPDTITVKPDGKYWRVVDMNLGSRRMDITTVIERNKYFEQAA